MLKVCPICERQYPGHVRSCPVCSQEDPVFLLEVPDPDPQFGKYLPESLQIKKT